MNLTGFPHSVKKMLKYRTPTYKPKEYWRERTDPNAPCGREPDRVYFDVHYIAQNIRESDNVFELGPGVGRTFHAYNARQKITTLDISDTYKDRLDERARELMLCLDQHILDEPSMKYPFFNDSFDVSVVFQVFIHQPPALFRHSFAEMCRISKKIVLSSGVSENTSQSPAPKANHVFAHDYLYETYRNNLIAQNVIVREGVLYMTVCRDTMGFYD